MENDDRYTHLMSATNPWEARMCSEFLRAQGIEAHVLNEQHNSMEPYLAPLVPCRVMVPREDHERSLELLAELRSAPTEEVDELSEDDDDGPESDESDL